MIVRRQGSGLVLVERIEEIAELSITPDRGDTFIDFDKSMKVPRRFFGRWGKVVPRLMTPPCHTRVKLCKITGDSRISQVFESASRIFGIDVEMLALNPADVIAFVWQYSQRSQNHLRDGLVRTYFPLESMQYEHMVGVVTMDFNGAKSITFEYVEFNEDVLKGDDGHCFVVPVK